MPGPVLGVDRIVLDGGVEPEAVPLVAVIERAFEVPGFPSGFAATTTTATPTAARFGLFAVVLGLLDGVLGLGGFELGLEGGGDERLVLGPQIGLLVDRGRGGLDVVPGLRRSEAMLALEPADVTDGHLELVGDPGIGPTLSDPRPDLIELGL